MKKKIPKQEKPDKATLKRRVKESERKIRMCDDVIADAKVAKKKAQQDYKENVNALLSSIPDPKNKQQPGKEARKPVSKKPTKVIN